MWAGLLWSRALLSVSMIMFTSYALITKGKEGVEVVRSSWWLKGILLLFFLPLISGFWSDDLNEWWNVVQVKLPLLFFPFCVPVLRDLDKNIVKKMLWFLIALVAISMTISLADYFAMDTSDYLKAKLFKVAVYDDHVRYSWLLVVVYSWVLFELLTGNIRQKKWAVLVLVLIAIYIHVLAAKTGLIGFYLVNCLAIASLNSKFKTFFIAALILLPLMAWFIIPSFQNRIRFVWWDFQNYSKGNYVEGLSDAPRITSWKAAVEIIQEHPVLGVGAGDIIPESKKWYAVNAPFLQEYEQLVPSNEVLLYGCYSGIIGGLVVLITILLPFFEQGVKRNMVWISFHIMAGIGFMYDLALETQFGVFIYVFFGLLFYAQYRKQY